MSVLLIVLAVLCVLVGIAGCILPVLPGPPLSFVALLLMRWSGAAEFDDELVRQVIEKITVVDEETIQVKFRGESEVREGKIKI